jgi:hypothetical protein
MPSRRVGAKKPENDPSAAMRAHGVILEQMQSQMNVVLEAVTGMRREIKADLSAIEIRLSERISVLEQVVRASSTDVRDLREEVARLRHDFEHRSELGRLAALEERVQAIETRLGRAG